MKTKGRRVSSNIEKQTSSEKREVLNEDKLIRDMIGNTNERIKEKTPISQVKPNMSERLNTINPGSTQQYGGYKINNRTFREGSEPGTLSKKNNKQDAKFFLK